MQAPRGYGLRIKLALAVLLTALADQLFYRQVVGWTLGGFAIALVVAILALQPAVRGDSRGRVALLLAAGFALVQVEAPTWLGGSLVLIALAVAVLSPRVASGSDVLRWSHRLLYLVLAGLLAPVQDGLRLNGRVRTRRVAPIFRLSVLVLPVLGGGIFVALFASANPVIGEALNALHPAPPDGMRVVFWLAILTSVWMFLRPRFLRRRPFVGPARATRALPGVSVASVGLCLVTFNAIFAVENGLDIAFLWSGARLPAGVSFADYAHRGAYPLIATALLAGLFVLVALRPGSATAASPWLRRLVVLWVAQNLLLVASSIQRTLNYVEVYSLTSLRIAALIWMGLVGVGLVLICWRLLRAKSAGWLMNANALAAGLVLALCSGVDLDAMSAEWNVVHAREVGGDAVPLDLRYLRSLGDAALVPLSELATRHLPPALHDEVVKARAGALLSLAGRQQLWRGWTWRGQRRLERANALVAGSGPTRLDARDDRRARHAAAG